MKTLRIAPGTSTTAPLSLTSDPGGQPESNKRLRIAINAPGLLTITSVTDRDGSTVPVGAPISVDGLTDASGRLQVSLRRIASGTAVVMASVLGSNAKDVLIVN